MTVAAKREKLHDLINNADDIKVDAIFSFVEHEVNNGLEPANQSTKYEKIIFMREAASDPLFLEDLKEIGEDFEAIDGENI